MAWNRVSSVGTLLVGAKKALYSLEPETGKLMWKRDDLKKTAPFNVREVPGTPILFVNDQVGATSLKSKLHALDILSGETLWNTGIMQGNAIGVFPFLHKK